MFSFNNCLPTFCASLGAHGKKRDPMKGYPSGFRCAPYVLTQNLNHSCTSSTITGSSSHVPPPARCYSLDSFCRQQPPAIQQETRNRSKRQVDSPLSKLDATPAPTTSRVGSTMCRFTDATPPTSEVATYNVLHYAAWCRNAELTYTQE